ncbi:MAG: hypothetical protein LBD93_00445, partial [Treponema sp.]|jgi:hypothetical protein|nr:hypothetical protein [Treponema sp.]
LFTAAKLLEKIKSVDGSNSGLDADTLDGQQGSYYASTNALSLKAPLASPALTGTPTAPTAAALTNNTQIATTAFVMAAITAHDPGESPTDTQGKTLLAEVAKAGEQIEISLTKGWYYVELQGGAGAGAPDYTESRDIDSEHTEYTHWYGEYGSSGDTIATPFFLPYDTKVFLKRGYHGGAGAVLNINGHSVPIIGKGGYPSYLSVPQYGICIYAGGGKEGTKIALSEPTGTPPLDSYARIYKKNE